MVVEDNVDATTQQEPGRVKIQVDAFKWNWQFEYHSSLGAVTAYPGTDKTTEGTYLADPSSLEARPADTSAAGNASAARTTPLPYYLSTARQRRRDPRASHTRWGRPCKIDEHSDDVHPLVLGAGVPVQA